MSRKMMSGKSARAVASALRGIMGHPDKSKYTVKTLYEAKSKSKKRKRDSGLSGETHYGTGLKVSFSIGLSADEMKELIGKTYPSPNRPGEYCRVGWGLTPEEKAARRFSAERVSDVFLKLRSAQVRSVEEKSDRDTIGRGNTSGSIMRMDGIYEGNQEKSINLTVYYEKKEPADAVFIRNMKRLAQDLACALAQKTVLTTIEAVGDTYEHSAEPLPDPGDKLNAWIVLAKKAANR